MSRRLYVALILVATATLLALTLFTYPYSDDFCFLDKAQRLGFIGAQVYWYTSWSGRYTASALLTALFMADRLWYPVASLVLCVLWFGSIWALLLAAGRRVFSHRTILLAAATLFVMYGAFAPRPIEALYWVTSTLTYHFGCIVLLGLLAFNIALTARPKAAGLTALALLLSMALNLALGIALGGTTETVVALAAVLLAAGAAFSWFLARSAVPFWVAGLVALLCGFGFGAAAPGNAARMQTIDTDHHLLPALGETLVYTLQFTAKHSTNPALWLCAALASGSLWKALPPPAQHWVTQRRGWLWLLVLWLAAIAAALFPSHYVTGTFQERPRNVAFVAFLFGWFPVVTALLQRFWNDRHLLNIPPSSRPLVFVVLALSLAGAPQLREMYKDLGNGLRYRSELAQREATIGDALRRGVADVAVAPLTIQPTYLFYADIERDPADYKNVCMAAAFGLRSIRIIDPPSTR